MNSPPTSSAFSMSLTDSIRRVSLSALPDDSPASVGNFRWHLMFHELWIGEEEHYSPLQRLVGVVQRRIASGFRRLHPTVIHTSNDEYQRRLGTIGLKAGVLPLFGNIPVAAEDPSARSMMMLGAEPSIQSHESLWIMVFFGGILPGWDPAAFLRYLRNECLRAKRDRCILVRLGNSGRNGERIWNAFREEAPPEFSFIVVGEASRRLFPVIFVPLISESSRRRCICLERAVVPRRCGNTAFP